MDDLKFGCGYDGPHLAVPYSTDALVEAVENENVTCIKLAPITYELSSTLIVPSSRTLALVAEDGQATLDGKSAERLLRVDSSADVALFNLVLSNGRALDSSVTSRASTNSASEGGAIHNDNGTVWMRSCVLTLNSANHGGAIANFHGTILMNTCTLSTIGSNA